MDESRFQRLEDKVDAIKEEVSDLKTDMRVHMATVERHVSADERIIEKINPLLDKFTEIVEVVEEHKFDKQLRQKKMETVKKWSARLGLVSVIISVIIGLSKLL